MKNILISILVISVLFSGCQTDKRITQTPATTSEIEDSIPAAEGVKQSEILEYRIRAADNYGSLLPLELEGNHVFLSDYPIDLNFLISPEILIELATPGDELYQLEEIPNLSDILESLNAKARVGKFVKKENYNTTGCLFPPDIKTPEEVCCGFQFTHEGIVYKILVFGTTIRDLENADKEPTRITTPPSGE